MPWFGSFAQVTFRIADHVQEGSPRIIVRGREVGKSVSIIPNVTATPVSQTGRSQILFDSGLRQT
jgi:hypothetical protein